MDRATKGGFGHLAVVPLYASTGDLAVWGPSHRSQVASPSHRSLVAISNTHLSAVAHCVQESSVQVVQHELCIANEAQVTYSRCRDTGIDAVKRV
jgi:hypothetical protein